MKSTPHVSAAYGVEEGQGLNTTRIARDGMCGFRTRPSQSIGLVFSLQSTHYDEIHVSHSRSSPFRLPRGVMIGDVLGTSENPPCDLHHPQPAENLLAAW